MQSTVGVQDITIEKGLTVTPLEASGLCYLPDVKLYVVVSDDTDRKLPVLFLMDSTGHIREKTVVNGLKRINDIEGISQDRRGYIYLLASQSFNRKGKQSSARKLLVRVLRSGKVFNLDKSVVLFDLLVAAASTEKTGEWAEFIRSERKFRINNYNPGG